MDYTSKIKHWDDIHVGDQETFTKTMTQTDMILWVGLTGDMNPVHIDKEYAQTTRFKDVIIPGLMVAGLISTVMTQSTFGNVYSGQTLKFIKPVYVRSFLDREIEGWQDAVSAMIAAMKIDQQARNVLIAHQFVAGAQTCDSEQAAMVGGVDQIAVSTFAAFDYVALGHLHSPQQVGRPHVRYSGSLMKYSFSEAAQHKQMVFADLREKGEIKLSFVPFQLPHDMRILRGTYDELAASGHEDAHREDYLRIILTDEEPVPDALARLRTVYPHIMELEYDNIRTSLQQQVESKVKERGAMELMAELYALQNNQPLSDKQRDCLRALLEASEEGEA